MSNLEKIFSGRRGGFFVCKRPRLSYRERIIFIKRLAILIKSGIPILESLDILKRQAGSRGAFLAIECIRAAVEKGQPLAAAMECGSKNFAGFCANIVRVGEMSGTLAQNLDYLAQELAKSRELRRDIIGSLVYPFFVVLATIAIIALLLGYVFPKILPVFQGFKTGLPWSTQFLIQASLTAKKHGIDFLVTAAMAGAALFLAWKKPGFRFWIHRNLLRAPIAGSMIKNYQIANCMRTLGVLLKGDIGIVDALAITGQTSGNLAYRAALGRIARGVARGGSILENMEREGVLFPALAAQMVGAGEAAGSLDSSLIYLAEIYEDEMRAAAKNLTVSIEPALMIFMGLLVGFVALSIISPIYGITQNLRF